MDFGLKGDFIGAVIRFKRIEPKTPPDSELMQLSELLIISRAAYGCECSEKGFTVSEIHKDLHLSKPAVSQTLNTLEKKGYIVRAINPDDRRKISVTVTPAGEAELEAALAYYNSLMDAVIERFGAKKASELIASLNELLDILESL